MQLEIDLTHPFEKSQSGQIILNANRKLLEGQNKKLLDFLLSGGEASILNSQSFGVFTLHSRICDCRTYLKNNFDITLQKSRGKEGGVSFYFYYLLPEDILKINLQNKNN